MMPAIPDGLQPSLALLASAAAVVVTAVSARIPAVKERCGDVALLMFAVAAAAAASGLGADPAWIVERRLAFDPFANFFHVVLALGAVAIAWLSLRHDDDGERSPLTFVALASSLFGMQVLASATGAATVWAGLELTGLSCAALVATHAGAHRAGALALLRGALASALLLLGFGLLAGLSGVTDYAALSSRLALVPSMPGGRAAMFTGVMLVGAALASRMAVAPWLLWPAGEAPLAALPVTVWVVAGGGLAGLAALGRFLGSAVCTAGEGGFWASPGGLEWASVLGAAAVLTMLAANFAVMRESNLRRLVAWLAVSQAGHLAMGLSVAGNAGLQASMLQGVVGALTLTGIAAALDADPRGDAGPSLDAIRGLLRRPGLGRVPALALLVFLLSWAGLWPLAGRVGRASMFSAAVDAGHWMLVMGAVAAGVVGWMGVVRIVAIALDRGGQAAAAQSGPAPAPDGDALLLLALLLAAVVGIGVAPSGLESFAARSVVFFGG